MIPAMMKEARNSSTVPPMLADHRQRLLGQVADLRLHALNEGRQIRMGLRPEIVELLADDRPLCDARRGSGNLQGVVAHAADQVMTESPSETISTVVGTTISTMPASTSTVAASPCFPPILRASF